MLSLYASCSQALFFRCLFFLPSFYSSLLFLPPLPYSFPSLFSLLLSHFFSFWVYVCVSDSPLLLLLSVGLMLSFYHTQYLTAPSSSCCLALGSPLNKEPPGGAHFWAGKRVPHAKSASALYKRFRPLTSLWIPAARDPQRRGSFDGTETKSGLGRWQQQYRAETVGPESSSPQIVSWTGSHGAKPSSGRSFCLVCLSLHFQDTHDSIQEGQAVQWQCQGGVGKASHLKTSISLLKTHNLCKNRLSAFHAPSRQPTTLSPLTSPQLLHHLPIPTHF